MADLRADLIKRLQKLGVEYYELPGRDDGFASLSYRGKEFAHFHNDRERELDIKLTRAVIEREGLEHPTESTVHPKRSKNSPWIEIRFKTQKDLATLQRLVQLTIENL
jgi:hypothetical protein